MARLKPEQWEDLIADWHTGQYSKNELSKKYRISHTAANKRLAGIEPKHKEKVAQLTRIRTELAEESFKEVSAVEREVSEATKHLTFIKNATLKNVSSMMQKITEKTTIPDHKAAQDTIDKAGQTLGVVDRNGPKVAVQQNNTTHEAPTQILIKGPDDR